MDVIAAVVAVASIAASAWVARGAVRAQQRLAADAARIERENELRSVLDSAALALRDAHQQLLATIERVDQPPSYDEDERQVLHEEELATSGRYWVRPALDELERALQELTVIQARLAARLGTDDPLYGVVHNTRNVLDSYGLNALRELGHGAAWTDAPFGESLRQ